MYTKVENLIALLVHKLQVYVKIDAFLSKNNSIFFSYGKARIHALFEIETWKKYKNI